MKPKIKRNKPIKACLACRTRKQKCDHLKPQCHQCSIRNIECVYLSDRTDADTISGRSSEIKAQSPADHSRCSKMKSLKGKKINPLTGAKFLFRKDDRWIACGVTSTRTIFHLHCNNKFNDSFVTAWKKLKQERNKWKHKYNYSSIQEWTVLAEPNVIRNGESLIDAVCRVLPPYEEIQIHLQNYFRGPRHKLFEVVDPSKIMRDFECCFIAGEQIADTKLHRVVSLIPTKTQNFHCMGVIIEILRTTFYMDIPKELEIFSGYLSSAASIKSLSLEKLQCVMLKAFHLDFTAMTGGDFSKAYMLIQMASSLATDLGIDSAIDIPTNTNEKNYIENLWWWVLYMDLQVSFNLGVPLQIGSVNMARLTFHLNGSKQEQIFAKTTLTLRKVMQDIYGKDSTPNIKHLILEIKDFISDNFRPLPFYMVAENYNFNEFREAHALLFLLTFISNLANIQKYYFHESNPETFNTTIQYSLASSYIAIIIVKCYYEMDKEDISSSLGRNSDQLPAHLQLGIWITYHTLGRVLCETYALMFSNLQGSIPTQPQESGLQVGDFSIESLEVNTERFISLRAVSQLLDSTFDMLYSQDCKDIFEVAGKSYCFLFILSLEKICRLTFENGITAKDSSDVQTTTTGQAKLLPDMTREGKSTSDMGQDQSAELLWNQDDSPVNHWIDADLEMCFSGWFDNFLD